MFNEQFFGILLTIAMVLAGPLIYPLVVAGTLLGAARKPWRAVLVLAICAMALLFISLALTSGALLLQQPGTRDAFFRYPNASISPPSPATSASVSPPPRGSWACSGRSRRADGAGSRRSSPPRR